MASGHKWRRIEDLGDDPQSLTDGELISLWRVWQAQKKELEAGGEYAEFDKRLRREWAIETGIIEDVYTLDRGVTKTLIARGIEADYIYRGSSNKDPVFVARVIQDHYDALEGLLDFVAGQRELTTGYVKQLHAALLRSVETYEVVDQFGRLFELPLERGAYKTTPNSPTRSDGSIHEYCPPEHVSSEMDELVRLHEEHSARRFPPEVEAGWLHHRFTQIHPFADGNGRVARALASLVFIKAGWFPLVIQREDKARYIDDLEQADAGDLRPLVARFVESQRATLIQASDAIYDLKPVATTHDAVLAVRDRLLQRGRLPMPEWMSAKTTADELFRVTQQAIAKVASDLHQQISALRQGFSFSAGAGAPGAFANERDSVLKALGLTGNQEYIASFNLALNAGKPDYLSITFQSVGPQFRGLIMVMPYLRIQDFGAFPVGESPFQINYEEDLETAKARFAPWLDRVIVRGLDEWRKRL